MDEYNIKNLLKKYNITPSKGLGQNFLINDTVIDKIINASDLNKQDVVLEIGPGLGFLTQELVKNVKKVVSVELDKKCSDIVRKNLNEYRNFQVLNKNILDIPNNVLLDTLYDRKNAKGNYKLIANIPYNITSPILQKFCEQKPKPELAVLLIQKEVAQRITAKPGALSILGISVQVYCNAEIIDIVLAKDFYPAPKVNSAIVALRTSNVYINEINKKDIEINGFFRIVKIGFSSKRKKLYNNLSSGLQITQEIAREYLTQADIKTDARAQELSIQQWIALAEIILKNKAK